MGKSMYLLERIKNGTDWEKGMRIVKKIKI